MLPQRLYRPAERHLRQPRPQYSQHRDPGGNYSCPVPYILQNILPQILAIILLPIFHGLLLLMLLSSASKHTFSPALSPSFQLIHLLSFLLSDTTSCTLLASKVRKSWHLVVQVLAQGGVVARVLRHMSCTSIEIFPGCMLVEATA